MSSGNTSSEEAVIYLFFRKVHGAGNDFIVVSGSVEDLGRDWSDMARELCARRTGIGADGLVISALLDAKTAALGITCYNADGSIATMCGNALRCAAWCAAEDHSFEDMSLLMAGVEHQASVQEDGVWVTAEVGAIDRQRIEVTFGGRSFLFDSAHTGTEHVVAIVEDLDNMDVEGCGRLIRNHPDLAPLGTNVNFIQPVSEYELKIRTYERGVEAETLSCGSGAVAATVVASLHGLVQERQVFVHNQSGTPLVVRAHSDRRDTRWINGPVTQVYQGKLTTSSVIAA
jgi:diaminopimelate epimerase